VGCRRVAAMSVMSVIVSLIRADYTDTVFADEFDCSPRATNSINTLGDVA
jgi:hypothetical protein